eukprot:9469193-Prorocentrum_lima.AAC.1
MAPKASARQPMARALVARCLDFDSGVVWRFFRALPCALRCTGHEIVDQAQPLTKCRGIDYLLPAPVPVL